MFWLKFGFFILIVISTISVVKFSLRKILKIEKQKKDFFSYDDDENQMGRLIKHIGQDKENRSRC